MIWRKEAETYKERNYDQKGKKTEGKRKKKALNERGWIRKETRTNMEEDI